MFSFSRRVDWCIIWPKMSKMKFDLRPRSWPDPNRSCCWSFDPYWRKKRNGAVLKPVSRFYQKLPAKNEWWPLVTSYGHSWPFEDSPRVFWISNLIYDTGSHNATGIERICWQLVGLEIYPVDVMGRSEKWPDLRSRVSKIRDERIVDNHYLITSYEFQSHSCIGVATVRCQT